MCAIGFGEEDDACGIIDNISLLNVTIQKFTTHEDTMF